MRIKTTDELQGPNLMISRHGASENPLQTCAQCRHLTCERDLLRVCEQFRTPSGLPMPWPPDNRACGLYEERTE